MLTFLIKRFVKDSAHMDDPKVRLACGMVAGLLGIVLNVLLFAGKLLAGVLSGSIAVTADAFNNLSDAGSSLVSLLGFRLAGKEPDLSHPFGHGRVEYVSGLIVSMAILLMGVELFKTSLKKVFSPEAVVLTPLTAAILLFSVAVKMYMCLSNRALGKKIDSATVRAVALDSLSDSAATLVVFLAMVLGHFTGWHVDGWAGMAVSLFILYAGFGAARDTINPLLGMAPDQELIKRLERVVLDSEHVLGIHDTIIHDYGPGRRMVSLHAEVPAEGDVLAMHDAIDCIEQQLKEELHCDAVIHMDPVVTDDARIGPLRQSVADALCAQIDPVIRIHDFRVVEGPTHNNLIFDAVVPFEFKLTDDELVKAIRRAVSELDEKLHVVVRIDKG